jgi:hypothetical protein
VTHDHSLFDDYLDACLAGRARPPDAFLAEHPEAGVEIREKIRALYRARVGAGESALPFERIGDYRLLHPLDAGGMGAVFVAEQESLGRVVALKLMRPSWAGDESAERRFAREAQAVAQLRHPGIVTVFESGVDGDTRYMAMEMVPGRMLSDVLAEAAMNGTPVPIDRIARWGAGLARALDYAHGRGIVHRDVKPENIRITPDDAPMILDYGIAVDLTGSTTTVTRAFQGSPAYAAPEQIKNEKVDGRTDVYGLGVTIYEALTGTRPFSAATVEGIFHRVLNETPRAPRQLQRSVSADLETVVLKAMEKRPADRYASAGDFAEDLEAVLAYRPVGARPPGPFARLWKWARRRPAYAVAAASALAFVLLLGALAVLQHGQREQARMEEARGLLTRATEAVAEYRTARLGALVHEEDLGRYRDEMRNRYFTADEDRTYLALETSMESGRRRRDELFHEVLTSLRRAERIDPELRGADAVRAALYVEKWEEARTARDAVRQTFFRGQAELYDPAGDTVSRFAETGRLALTLEPPAATAWLFGFREHREVAEGGWRRLVPVPVGASAKPPVPYGSVVLRVVRGSAPLQQGDLILSLRGHDVADTLFVRDAAGALGRLEAVDGHAMREPADLEEALAEDGPHRFRIDGTERHGPDLAALGLEVLRPAELAAVGGSHAHVVNDGATRDIVLPEGLVVRRTATPLFPAPEARIGADPRQLPVDHYLLVARAPGHEEMRVGVPIARDLTTQVSVRLVPVGTTPEGFVRIPADRHGAAFLIMEREVTCAEYAEFLDDEGIRTRVKEGVFALVPRGPLGDWYWHLADGRFVPDPDWLPDTPVMGLSFHDAQTYVRWRSDRDGVTYSLPTEQQWNRASGHWPFRRLHSFGDVFFPKWVSSNWARPLPRPEPTFRYPVDESPFGVFGTSGGAMEWIDAWWDKARTLRWLAGGAWGYADPAVFRSPGGWGNRPDKATGTYGFRLVREP